MLENGSAGSPNATLDPFVHPKKKTGEPNVPLVLSANPRHSMYAIYAYIGVVLGVNVCTVHMVELSHLFHLWHRVVRHSP